MNRRRVTLALLGTVLLPGTPPLTGDAAASPARAVVAEIAYGGSLTFQRDVGGLAENGGGCGLSADNEHAPVSNHASARLNFRAIWRLSIPARGAVADRSLLGHVSTRGSRYAFRGAYYDDACHRHSYPAGGGTCRGALGVGDGPTLEQFALGRRIGFAVDPLPVLSGGPATCAVSAAPGQAAPPDRTVDDEILSGLPDATAEFSLGLGDLVHRRSVRRDVDLARRAPDTCLQHDDQERCSQRVSGRARIVVRRLRIVR
ncbi:MAG: hypothetical protein QOK31_1811 [Solirubrobacteraceae bacterium]|nr:hypothetical protein [Solirubrobacteraceae bacterium]